MGFAWGQSCRLRLDLNVPHIFVLNLSLWQRRIVVFAVIEWVLCFGMACTLQGT